MGVKAVVVRSVGAVLGAVDNSNLDADNTERRRDVMKQVAEQVLVNRDTDSSVEGVVNSLLGELGEDMIMSIYEKVIGSDVSSEDKVREVLADVISMVSDEVDLGSSARASVETYVGLIIYEMFKIDKDVLGGPE